ncbi:hypothetical protein [Gulosibacter chungangensis]|nr:hypothetical protein [Gulosibacter chungangensis]
MGQFTILSLPGLLGYQLSQLIAVADAAKRGGATPTRAYYAEPGC